MERPNFKFNPADYEMWGLLGEGGYGDVVEYRNIHSGHAVAAKITRKGDNKREASILEKIMRRNFDRYNIIKFYGRHELCIGESLVFEILDIDLFRYLSDRKPMLLSDIRDIIRQMTTALTALQCMGLIHCDLKPDNIMIVDKEQKPLSVKMIDFGLALHKVEIKQGMILQAPPYRSPEIILGLPISEAIDMWSLGCVLAKMISGHRLFNVNTEEELLWSTVKLLGQPKDFLLNGGTRTKTYFDEKRNFFTSTKWKLKKSEENGGQEPSLPKKHLKLKSLDDLKKLRLERNNKAEAREREQCVELLKAMLELDPTKRIKPAQVFKHPFITNLRPEYFKPDLRIPPSRMIMARPATPINMLRLTEAEREDGFQRFRTSKTYKNPKENSGFEPAETLGTIEVQPDLPRRFSPRRIVVKPATPEKILGAVKKKDSFQTRLKTYRSSVGTKHITKVEIWRPSGTKKERKKNVFLYFFNEMEKTFCFCWTSSDYES